MFARSTLLLALLICCAYTPSASAGRLEQKSFMRSEEHTSELQSQSNLVCRLLLEKKKNIATRGQHRRDDHGHLVGASLPELLPLHPVRSGVGQDSYAVLVYHRDTEVDARNAILPRPLSRKPVSPTTSTSSTAMIGGSIWAATAKARRSRMHSE